ncbi:MAG: hypothetical protein ABI556_04200 [Gemmatimonadales bacterium]
MIRNSMLRMAAVVLPMAAAASVASAQNPSLPSAASLVAKYSAAVGAPAFVNAKAIITNGAMSMPAAGMNATFEMTQVAQNQMSMVTTIPGMGEVTVGFDGTTAWAVDPMQGPRVLSGKELDEMKDGADRRVMSRQPDMFTTLQTVADTTMNSERCYLVKFVSKANRESYDCFSASSGLIVASKSTQKTAMGDIPVVSLLSDYKKFGDFSVATKNVQELMGQQQIVTISSVAVSDGVGVKIAPPAAIQAMVKK